MKTAFVLILTLCFTLFLRTSPIDWEPVFQIIQSGINEGIFSGCVLGVSTQNSTLLKEAFGTTIPKRGFYAPPMKVDYKFDLNRLTQVIGTNLIMMQLYDNGNCNVTRRVAFLLKDFDNNGKTLLTIQNMQQHNSGFPATYDGPIPGTPAELLKNIQGLKLTYKTQSQFLYSQIGYTVLGHLVEHLKNQTLKDAMFQILIMTGMRDTGFIPTSNKYEIVPGGYNHGVCQGIPANKYAHALTNMAGGNAGLFSTVSDIITYMQLMLNKGKMKDSARIFSEEVVDLYTKVASYSKYTNTMAKGWDTVPKSNPPCGKKFSRYSFGLADTSGSYVWSDREKNVTIVFLANGNFPVERKTVPTDFQGKLSDAIMTALGY